MKKIRILYNGKEFVITPEQYKSKYRAALQGKEFQYEVFDDELTDASEFLPGNVEAEANAPVRAGQPTQVKMPVGMVDTPAVTEVQLETLKTPLGMIGNNEVTEVQREMLETARQKNTRGGIAEREQQSAIKQARGQALNEEGETLFPYLRKARAEGTDEEMGALKDVAAMVPRGYVALQELYANDGYVDATPKTSEEYLAEGRLGKGILTSPTTFPSILAAMATGGMSIPTQIGAQVAVNAPLMEDYGGANLGLDAILTALPAGVGLVAGKAKSAGMAAIRKALEAKGIKDVADDVVEQAYDMWAGKTAGEAISKKAGGKLASMLEGPAGPPSVIKTSKDYNWLLKNLSNPGEKLLGYDAVRKEIAASTKLAKGAAGRRTEDEAAEALKKVAWMEGRESLLKSKAAAGGYDPEAYIEEVTTALGKVADVPELIANARINLTKAGASARRTIPMILSSTPGPAGYRAVENSVQDVLRQPLQQELSALQVGKALQNGMRPEVTAGRVFMEPRLALADLVKGNAPAAYKVGEGALRLAAPVAPSLALPYQTRLKDFYRTGDPQ